MDPFSIERNVPRTIQGVDGGSFDFVDQETVSYGTGSITEEGIKLSKRLLEDLVLAAKKNGGLEGPEVLGILADIPAEVPRLSLEKFVNYYLDREPIVLSNQAGAIYKAVREKAEALAHCVDPDPDNPAALVAEDAVGLSIPADQFQSLKSDDLRNLIEALNDVKENLTAEQNVSGATFVREATTYARQVRSGKL